jgi:oxygen-dependent protoporphyrinogen oxidase
MTKKEIIVLGGGISGLSLAWYLKQYSPGISIKILEKSSRLGGVIGPLQGPKTLRVSKGETLLRLIEQLQLQDQIVYSSPASTKRYLYYEDELQQLPKNPLGFFLSPLTRKAVLPLIREVFIKKGDAKDETIGSFVRRRFGNYIAEVFVEPFVTGICGGSMDQLSIATYFPLLKHKEQEHGSVIKGMFKGGKDRKNTQPKKRNTTLFNLKGGLITLIKALEEALKESVYLNHEVLEVKQLQDRVEVITDKGTFLADHVFSALSLEGIKTIKMPFPQEVKAFFQDLKASSIASVTLSYKDEVLPVQGFGYLVPSLEKQNILGVLFDSEIFPSIEEPSAKTLLTVMMGGTSHPDLVYKKDEELVHLALDALFAHLGVYQSPISKLIYRYEGVLPQCPPHHQEKMQQVKQQLQERCPYVSLVGNYIGQAAVHSCIHVAEQAAKEYAQCLN